MRLDRGAAVRWGVSLALMLPVIALYACEYLRGDGRTFTGFIQYDQPNYMADARKFFDGGFHFLYGNPFSFDPETPRIYFQFQLLFLGLVQAVTGLDPGLIFVGFGFVAGLVCVRVAMALYEEVAGLGSAAQWIGLVLFLWGGGLLAVMGAGYHVAIGSDLHATLTDLFCFDPAQGWWFLNLGRNLVFPLEAYYHALALGLMLALMRRNFRAALWLAFALMMSHPFTGLQFLLIVLAWCVWETGVMRDKTIPRRFALMILGLLFFHLFYNLILLNLFEEHRVIFMQWSIAWIENVPTTLGAYCFVGAFALCAMRSSTLARELFSKPGNRLLLIWFLVSFALVHHDLVMQPRQPIHFSRGYVWVPLFLLGIQPILGVVRNCLSPGNRVVCVTAVGIVFLVGLSDNIAWFGLHGAMARDPRLGLGEDGFNVTSDDRELYRWLNQRPQPHREFLVAPDNCWTVVYLAMTYTDYRGWYSHYVNTPYINQRKKEAASFFQTGALPVEWAGKSLFVIVPKGDITREGAPADAFLLEEKTRLKSFPLVYQNGLYEVRLLTVQANSASF